MGEGWRPALEEGRGIQRPSQSHGSTISWPVGVTASRHLANSTRVRQNVGPWAWRIRGTRSKGEVWGLKKSHSELRSLTHSKREKDIPNSNQSNWAKGKQKKTVLQK